MKRLALLSSLCFALLGASAVFAENPSFPTTAPAARPATALAPADRCFGAMKMSVLEMRNAIKDISFYTDVGSAADMPTLFHKLTLVENALRDLKTQFPTDTWIPGLGLGLAQAFLKLHVGDAAVRANDAIDWVIADYPRSSQAIFAKGLRRATSAVASGMDPVPLEPTITLRP